MGTIKDNINRVRERISEEVQLVCVSKTKPVDLIKEAYDCGERVFGENKAQEIRDKYELLPKDIKWHFIGHLQRNKVKYVVGKIDLLHSLDGERLLDELEKKYEKIDETLDALIQINIGEEDNKTGLHIDQLKLFIEKIEQCKYIKVKGLMAIIPQGSEEECRENFRKMKSIYDELACEEYKNITMEILSMGMSGDYKIAVDEGSNMIRVGSGIFGAREYKK